ncbi:MAG: hypothetical protein WCG47_12830 [Dermatophilaceae bacterium]
MTISVDNRKKAFALVSALRLPIPYALHGFTVRSGGINWESGVT